MSETAPQNYTYSDIDIHSDVALADIRAERRRQITEEGYGPEHDDAHASDELAEAAGCYALPARWRKCNALGIPWQWPWDGLSWKPGDRRRELVKAGALIVAEIARLDRAAEKEGATK